MKVDVENCPACGAKNSKFVQQCYRCQAELPWSPNYKAPAPKPVASPTPVPKPSPAPGTPTPTVTLPPANSAAEPTPAGQPTSSPSLPPAVAENLKKVPAKVEAPTWGLIAVGAGVLFLGMGLMAVMMNSRRPQPTMIIAPTPVASVATTPAPAAVPPGATPVPGQTPAPAGTAAPAATGAPAGTPAPGATLAPAAAPAGTPAPAETPAATPAATPATTAPEAATPVAPAAPPRIGPNFQDATAKLEKATNSTQAQKQAYWKSIQGTLVTWTGEIMDADSNGGGKISLRCAPDAKTADVQVNLDGSQTGMLVSLNKGKKVTVQGILQDHSSAGYVLSNGRITAQD